MLEPPHSSALHSSHPLPGSIPKIASADFIGSFMYQFTAFRKKEGETSSFDLDIILES